MVALTGEPSAARPAPRFGRLLLKGGLAVMMLAGSFTVGQHFGHSPRVQRNPRARILLKLLYFILIYVVADEHANITGHIASVVL